MERSDAAPLQGGQVRKQQPTNRDRGAQTSAARKSEPTWKSRSLSPVRQLQATGFGMTEGGYKRTAETDYLG